MSPVELSYTGAFGQAVRAASIAAGDVLHAPGPQSADDGSVARWLVMGHADLGRIEQVAASGPAPLVAAFLCARYLVVTPCFEQGTGCPSCFRRRFLSMPPPGLAVEAVLALSLRGGADSGFDAGCYAPALPHIARLLLHRQLKQRCRKAWLIDQSGMQHLSAPLVPVHGCACRGDNARPNRFTSFHRELFHV